MKSLIWLISPESCNRSEPLVQCVSVCRKTQNTRTLVNMTSSPTSLVRISEETNAKWSWSVFLSCFYDWVGAVSTPERGGSLFQILFCCWEHHGVYLYLTFQAQEHADINLFLIYCDFSYSSVGHWQRPKTKSRTKSLPDTQTSLNILIHNCCNEYV